MDGIWQGPPDEGAASVVLRIGAIAHKSLSSNQEPGPRLLPPEQEPCNCALNCSREIIVDQDRKDSMKDSATKENIWNSSLYFRMSIRQIFSHMLL